MKIDSIPWRCFLIPTDQNGRCRSLYFPLPAKNIQSLNAGPHKSANQKTQKSGIKTLKHFSVIEWFIGWEYNKFLRR